MVVILAEFDGNFLIINCFGLCKKRMDLPVKPLKPKTRNTYADVNSQRENKNQKVVFVFYWLSSYARTIFNRLDSNNLEIF